MKKLLILALMILSFPISALAAFNDVSSSNQFYDAINYLQSQGIADGYLDSTFKPDNLISRAEFLKIIVGAAFSEEEISPCLRVNSSNMNYSDASKSEWYSPYLCLATLKSIVKGYEDGSFKPDAKINMAEASKIIYLSFNFGTVPKDRAIWYLTYIEYLESRASVPTSIKALDQRITRGEMAEIIYRLRNNITNLPTTSFSKTCENGIGVNNQLEINEQNPDSTDPEATALIKAQAQTFLDKILTGGDFRVLGLNESQTNPGKIFFEEWDFFQYKDEVFCSPCDDLFNLEKGKTLDRLIETYDIHFDYSDQLTQGVSSYSIIQVTDKRYQERIINTPKQIFVRHILVAYKGAQVADDSITRSEEQARIRAEGILVKLKDGEDFSTMAKEYSDDAGSKPDGGALTTPVTGTGTYILEFEDAADATSAGQISQVFKSPFGYHILKVDRITPAKTETKIEPQVKITRLFYNTLEPWKKTGLNSSLLLRADVEFNQLYEPNVMINFNDEGAKLFEEVTGRNIGKPLAIFIGCQLISAPIVNEKISGGRAYITGRFTLEQANSLADDLNNSVTP